MPKDPKRNVDRYKIAGGELNEFEFHQNQGQMNESAWPANAAGAEQFAKRAENATLKKPKVATAKKSDETATAKKSTKRATRKKSAKSATTKKRATTKKLSKKAAKKSTRKKK